MDDNSISLDGQDLDLDNIGEALGGDFGEQDAAPQGDSTADPGPEAQATEEQPQANQEWNPEGPGNIREALRQERERARQYEQQLAQYQAWAAQVQQQQAYQQQLADQQQQQEFDPLDPDMHAWTQAQLSYVEQQIAQVQQSVQQQFTQWKLQQSGDYARAKYQDFDAAMEALVPFEQYVNWDLIRNSENPAEATYQLAKGFMAHNPQAIEQIVQQRLSQIVPKLTQPASPQGARTLGALPAAATNSDTRPDPLPTNRQLARMDEGDVLELYRQALRQTT